MAKWWQDFPWRLIQTNLREIDIISLDPVRFVADLKAFHANSVMFNFGGTEAFYPSKVKDHYINPFLKGDPLKTLVELCHENNIKVIARTDFSKMHKSIFEAHPDWAYVEDGAGALDSNGFYSTCQSGGFQHEFMDNVISEIINTYKVDGIYCNMGGFMTVDYNLKLHGPCQCENCKKTFASAFNMELPQKDLPFADPRKPEVATYQKFKAMVTAQQKKRVTELIKSINPEVAYCGVDYTRLEANTELGRPLPPWMYNASSNTRMINSTHSRADNADVDMMGFASRGASVSPYLQQYRLYQALANFGGLDYFIMGRLDNKEDTSAYENVKTVFSFAAENEKIYGSASSCATVLMIKDSYKIPSAEERGWVRFFTELHIPFDEVIVPSLKAVDFSQYSLVVLPSKARLAEEVIELLDDFVFKGGKLLVSGKSVKLKSIGVSPKVAQNEATGAYLKLSSADKAILGALKDRSFVPVGKGWYGYEGEAKSSLCAIMPPQCFGPPELCYEKEEPTGGFGLLINDYGAGKTAYLPWEIGTLYFNEGYDVWFLFAKAVVEEVLGQKSIAPELSEMVEVTYGKCKEGLLVSLVNGTGHFSTSFFKPVEVRDIEIVLPWNLPTASCYALSGKKECQCVVEDGQVRIKLDKLGMFETLVINK